MKKLFTTLATFCFFTSAHASDTYKLDPNHTNITWSANHFGFSNPSGKFADSDGTLILDEKNPQNSSIEVIIKTTSLVTGLAKFDEHLKSKDFFNVEKFPTAKFVSTSIALVGKTNAKVKGDLTLLGITKPITLDVKLNKIGTNPISQRKTAGFSASSTIKRSQFGIEFGLPGVSDDVKLTIESEANIVSSNNSNPSSKETSSNTEWKIIPEKSKIEFKAKQDNSNIGGSFKKFSGKINFDPNQLQSSKVMIDVDTSSVETSFNEAADTIKSTAWLAVSAFPKSIFTAEKFVFLGGKKYRAEGKLTMKGKAVPLSLDFNLEEYSKTSARATGSTLIKRTAFAIGDKDIKKANGVKDEIEVIFTINAER
jgi:polyisoprenoid-binding protein YceI